MDIMARSGMTRPKAVATLIAALVVASTATGVVAQESEPDLTAGLPQGISVTLLGDHVLDGSTGASATLRFDRISIAPDGSTDTLTTGGPTLVIAESGNALLRDAALGLEGSLDEGESRPLPAGVGYALRNDGTEPVSLLLLELVPSGSAPSAPTGTGADTTVLGEALDTALPATPGHLFVLEVSLDPGASLGETRYEGPLGIAVTDGDLTVTGPTGTTGTVPTGAGLVLPSGTQNVIANHSSATTTILAFGVLPEISLVKPRTALDSPGPSAEPKPPEGVLFSATAKAKQFGDWPSGTSWKVVKDRLLNDGSESDVSLLAAPIDPGVLGVTDYAVEIGVRWIRDGSGFGVFARSDEDSAYFGGVNTPESACVREFPVFVSRGLDFGWNGYCRKIDNTFDQVSRQWDRKWHTLRLEVSGASLRFLVDGKALLEADDARLSDGGTTGLWSYRNQIEVRCFAVMTVDTKEVC